MNNDEDLTYVASKPGYKPTVGPLLSPSPGVSSTIVPYAYGTYGYLGGGANSCVYRFESKCALEEGY